VVTEAQQAAAPGPGDGRQAPEGSGWLLPDGHARGRELGGEGLQREGQGSAV